MNPIIVLTSVSDINRIFTNLITLLDSRRLLLEHCNPILSFEMALVVDEMAECKTRFLVKSVEIDSERLAINEALSDIRRAMIRLFNISKQAWSLNELLGYSQEYNVARLVRHK
jgi:hypothetical protein